MQSSPPARFVVDTHTLWWSMRSPQLLSDAATSVFQMAAAGDTTIVVPAIVVAELYFLSVKARQPLLPAILMADLDSGGWAELTALGRPQLAMLDQFPEIPDIHDRLIAAESVYRQAPLVTRDRLLIASPQVETIW